MLKSVDLGWNLPISVVLARHGEINKLVTFGIGSVPSFSAGYVRVASSQTGHAARTNALPT